MGSVTDTIKLMGQPAAMGDKEFVSGSIPNLLSFGFEKVNPPSALYVQRDDQLFIQAISQNGGETLNVVVRLLLPTGQTPAQPSPLSEEVEPIPVPVGPGTIQTIVRTLAIPNSAQYQTLVIPMTEGYLLSVSAFTTVSQIVGQTQVQAILCRGASVFGNFIPAVLLINDYPTNLIPAGWPSIQQQQPAMLRGSLTSQGVANPAAGAEWSFTTFNPARTHLLSVRGLLTTSAVAGNRSARIRFSDALGNVIGDFGPARTQAAGRAYTYNGAVNAQGADDTTTAFESYFAIPRLQLGGAYTVGSITAGIDAGDQWSNIRLTYEVWMG